MRSGRAHYLHVDAGSIRMSSRDWERGCSEALDSCPRPHLRTRAYVSCLQRTRDGSGVPACQVRGAARRLERENGTLPCSGKVAIGWMGSAPCRLGSLFWGCGPGRSGRARRVCVLSSRIEQLMFFSSLPHEDALEVSKWGHLSRRLGSSCALAHLRRENAG